jgi:hypothetical protein
MSMENQYEIHLNRFNDDSHLESRVSSVPPAHRGAVRTCLSYLYQDSGPLNLPRERLLAARQFLEPAELVVAGWLFTRTNGRLRSAYGSESLKAARTARYRCSLCGFSDVRVLNLDHVNGRVEGTLYACLCANCHTIKSRRQDWTGISKPAALTARVGWLPLGSSAPSGKQP